MAGAREGHLAELFREAGLSDVEDTSLTVSVAHASFEAWWELFTLGVGPAGRATSRGSTRSSGRELRELCREEFPADGVVTASAWTARGRAA